MHEMLAAVAHAPHTPVEIKTLRLDDPRPNELVVKVQASGICHSDLSGRDQHYPFSLPGVLGHEGAGMVVDVGTAVEGFAIGDRVIMSQAFCGQCEACRSGRVNVCPHASTMALQGTRSDGSALITDEAGNVISGAFLGQSSWATHAIVREPNVVRIDDDLPWEVAAPLACGVQTGAGAVFNLVDPDVSTSVVIFGAGAVGLGAVMAARYAGAGDVIVADPQAHRLALARELGATHTFDPTAEDAVGYVLDVTRGGANFVLEASGALRAGPLAARCLERSGTLVLLGVPPYGTKIELDWVSLVSGQTVLGRPFGGGTPRDTIRALLKMRAAGALPLERLIHTYAFDDINQAITDMESGVAIKPVLLCA
ncbi:NAD(P)-dependent alcohol dehydrogenase [uncultured Jatrophihabitans sp.]|uniref:NAD(P)-dependent alcohol dehydrogenase n=1 Tax=uncultured Jatrophihabitans sp. TaxID=1610747 RepID=UPI0035C97A79